MQRTVQEDLYDLYRGINVVKKGYQPKCNLVKNKNDDLDDSHNILNKWTNYFYGLEF
jgi:hypothetical protein